MRNTIEKLSSKCKSFIVGKLRLAWRYYSENRKECLKSKTCVSCKQVKRKIFADHKEPIGTFIPEENLYLVRLFCPSGNLQPLCKGCHDSKTKQERLERKNKGKQ